MAINIKDIIINGLLDLNKSKQLESITIKQLLEKTDVSRQTFYNHFIDKNDLIQYVYDTKMRGIGMEKLFEDGETKGNPYE